MDATGPGGRITQEDVQAYVKSVLTSSPAPVASGGGVVAPPLPDFSQFGPIERQPLTLVHSLKLDTPDE